MGGGITNKIKKIKLGLSIILVSLLLIIPVIAFGAAPWNKENFNTSNSINNSTISSSNGNVVTRTYGTGPSKFQVHIKIDPIAKLSPSTVPPVGKEWDNSSGQYATYTSTYGNPLVYTMKTEKIDASTHTVAIKFESDLYQGMWSHGTYSTNLSRDTAVPTFVANPTTGKTVLPSVIKKSGNYQDYINVNDSDNVMISHDYYEVIDEMGVVNVKGTYRATTYVGSGQIVRNFYRVITGFAKSTPNAPDIKTIDSAINKILPSQINKNNYQDYLTIKGVKFSDIDIISFTPHDTTGKLDFKIKYYTTSYHSATAPSVEKTYFFENFASSNSCPKLSVRANVNKILPSKIKDSNYTQYLFFDMPSSIKIINSFKADDTLGTLAVDVSYYPTSYHGSETATTNHTYNFTTFASLITPQITLKQDNISQITEANFANMINNRNPSEVTNALKEYVTISNVKPTDITNISYSDGQMTITYHSTSYSYSPTLTIKQRISGFAPTSSSGSANSNTTIIAIVCTLIILLLACVGWWYYYRNYYNRSKPTHRSGGRNGGYTANSRLLLTSNSNTASRRNTRSRTSQNNHIRGDIRGQSYSNNYGPRPLSSRSRGRYPTQMSQQYPPQSRGQYSTRISQQHPSQTRGRYPTQIIQQHPAPVRGQYPMRVSQQHPNPPRGQYPTQANYQYPRQQGGRYPTQANPKNPGQQDPYNRKASRPPNGSTNRGGKTNR